MPDSFSCITCQVLFKSPELQREHYKSDWHRYNLKRKVASIPSVTLEEFETRVKEHRDQAQDENRDDSHYCKCCSKLFNTTNAYNNHLNSKKHKSAQEKTGQEDDHSHNSDADSFVKVDASEAGVAKSTDNRVKFTLVNTHGSGDEDAETASDIEELDSDEWDELRIKGSDSLIKPQDCLFCSHHSKNMVKNLKHMSEAHSFFIPDVEYCVDVRGLLLYLGEKISQGYMCLWCNETGRTFYSMEAARGHMVDKGHCKMLHEGVALAEYADYYDYSTSYPDQKGAVEDMDVEEEVEGPATLEGDDFQLVLPSGITVGHRSLMRYYKQNVTHSTVVPVKKSDRKLHRLLGVYRALGWAPRDQALAAKYYKQNVTHSTVVPVKKSDRKLHRLLGVYRALGWAPRDQALAAKNARDIHFMKRVQAKWQMKMSLKNNKFQKHYREQVNF